MRFEFRFGADGRIDVLGTLGPNTSADVYRKNGPYRWDEGQLITPALNEGKPVQIELQDDWMMLWIDKRLSFDLKRQ